MLGYDHDSFWDQTPRTLSLTYEAHQQIQIKEQNDRAWLAWHVAALQRTKKIPPMRSMLIKTSTPRVNMEEQIQNLARWVKATGGNVIYKQ